MISAFYLNSIPKGESMKEQQSNTPERPSLSPDILNHPERCIRLPEVKAFTGYSTASIYAKMAKGTFPAAQKKHKLG